MQADKQTCGQTRTGHNCEFTAGKETKMRAGSHEDLDGGIVQQTAEMDGKNRRAGRLTYKQSCGWAERQTDRLAGRHKSKMAGLKAV